MKAAETVSDIKKSLLYEKILDLVSQIPREACEGDAPDAFSISWKLEQLFIKELSQLTPSIKIEWVNNKAFCNEQLIGYITYDDDVVNTNKYWIAFDNKGKGINLFETESEAKQAVKQSFKDFISKVVVMEQKDEYFCKDCIRDIPNLRMNDHYTISMSPYKQMIFAAKCPEGKCKHDIKEQITDEQKGDKI
ncbi:MAG: hypothetical protein H8E98_03085 [Bacteroidetes bacterium]|nr:hypothetical protein [Bacteroidota bacterium]